MRAHNGNGDDDMDMSGVSGDASSVPEPSAVPATKKSTTSTPQVTPEADQNALQGLQPGEEVQRYERGTRERWIVCPRN